MTTQEAKAAADKVLSEVFDTDVTKIDRHRPFTQTQFDSIDLLDALSALELRFGVSFEREELKNITTRASLHDLILNKLGIEKPSRAKAGLLQLKKLLKKGGNSF